MERRLGFATAVAAVAARPELMLIRVPACACGCCSPGSLASGDGPETAWQLALGILGFLTYKVRPGSARARAALQR